MTRGNFWSVFIYIFWSTIKGVQNGVVRALSQQKKNTYVTLIFAYGFGVPLAYVFCFVKPVAMGLQGLWLGISIANFLLVVAISVLISNFDWDAVALKNQEDQAKIQKERAMEAQTNDD